MGKRDGGRETGNDRSGGRGRRIHIEIKIKTGKESVKGS